MELENRIKAFAALGKLLKGLSEETLNQWADHAFGINKWFSRENVIRAFNGIQKYLQEESLRNLVSQYHLSPDLQKRVGVVMAGNIPLAGFHDFLCVMLSGHIIEIKKSSQDPVLLDYIIKELIEIEPGFSDRIRFADKLNNVEAIIATGSDNTSRYFEYYFANRPHIIRKNRVSIGVLNGNETPEELQELGKDVFTYFGLGCRSVSKVYVPEGYDSRTILSAFESFGKIREHNKFANNYDYNHAIYLLKNIPFLDLGFLILKEDEGMASPISVLYYEYYKSVEQLQSHLDENREKLQVIVSSKSWFPGSIEIGQAQCPSLTDFADNVDTLDFLQKL